MASLEIFLRVMLDLKNHPHNNINFQVLSVPLTDHLNLMSQFDPWTRHLKNNISRPKLGLGYIKK